MQFYPEEYVAHRYNATTDFHVFSPLYRDWIRVRVSPKVARDHHEMVAKAKELARKYDRDRHAAKQTKLNFG